MSYNQLQKNNSDVGGGENTEPKGLTLQLCPKAEDIGEFQIQNSICHIQVEHTWVLCNQVQVVLTYAIMDVSGKLVQERRESRLGWGWGGHIDVR